MKNQNWIQDFTYLKSINPLKTTWLIPSLSASHFLLSEHTWSPHQAWSQSLLEFTQEENEFLHKTKRMRDKFLEINPCLFSKNPLKKNFLENLDGIFLEGKHP